MSKITELLSEAKYLIATIGVIVGSSVGGYNFIGDFFITTASAEELHSNIEQQQIDHANVCPAR